MPTWAPSWAALAHLGAKLGCQGALGAPSWAAKAHLGAILSSNLVSKCLPGVAQTLEFARQYSTLATFSRIAFFAAQVLLDCFLACLLALLGVFWAQLGASWAPSGLNLGPLGHPSGLNLGPLGRQVGLPRRSWAPSWAAKAHLGAKLGCQGALGRQLGANWTPIGRQVSTKLACQNGCQCQRAS